MLKRYQPVAPERIAIDPGGFSTRFYCPINGLLLDEPSIALLDLDASHPGIRAIRQYGQIAIDKYQSAPDGRRLVSPLQSDSVNNFGYSPAMLTHFLQKSISQGRVGRSPTIALTIPPSIDHILTDQLRHACFAAGASQVHPVDTGVAATLGAGEYAEQLAINVLIDFGSRGATLYASVEEEMVAATPLFCGGDFLDEQLVDGIRERFGILIPNAAAREAKHRVGCAIPGSHGQRMSSSFQLEGMEIDTNQQSRFRIGIDTTVDILQPAMRKLAGSIHTAAEALPATVKDHLLEHGILLTGGGASLAQLDQLVMEATGVPVEIASRPSTTTVHGSGILLSRIYGNESVASSA